MDPEQLQYSVNRAKRDLKHKAMMIRADRLLTLTYRENITDRERAYKHLEQFVKRCHKAFNGFDYVAVSEKQKRGAIHFHLAVNRFYHVNIVRAIWRSIVGQDNGNIDMTPPRGRGPKNVVQIARYLSKYMAKDMDENAISKKRYSSSRGIPKPEKKTFYIPMGPNTFRLVSMLFQRHIGKNFSRWAEITDSDRHILWFSTF